MTDRELMQQALEALENAVPEHEGIGWWKKHNKAKQALRERLAQPEQKPVALETVYDTIIYWDETDGKRSRRELARRIIALYTTPQPRQWVGLTEEERDSFWKADQMTGKEWQELFDAIEAKLKEKNA